MREAARRAIASPSRLGREQLVRPLHLRSLLRALRPLQWTKNAAVLAALVFSGELFDLGSLARAVAAVVVFCCVSSGV